MGDLEALASTLPPPAPVDPGNPEGWAAVEASMRTRLPTDYKRFIEAYGTGTIDDFLTVLNPFATVAHFRLDDYGREMLEVLRALRTGGTEQFPHPVFPEAGGLLPWGVTSNGDWGYWITDPSEDPDRWALAINIGRGPDWYRHPGPLLRFLAELLGKEIRVPFFPDDFPSDGADFTPLPAPSP